MSKSANNFFFIISQPKHMLLVVLKRIYFIQSSVKNVAQVTHAMQKNGILNTCTRVGDR